MATISRTTLNTSSLKCMISLAQGNTVQQPLRKEEHWLGLGWLGARPPAAGKRQTQTGGLVLLLIDGTNKCKEPCMAATHQHDYGTSFITESLPSQGSSSHSLHFCPHAMHTGLCSCCRRTCGVLCYTRCMHTH
jgi:hypothetical protein